MKKSNKTNDNDFLSIITTFFDEAVATNSRQRIFTALFCGIGATIFSIGIVIGTTKVTDEKKQDNILEQKTERNGT